MRRAIILGVLLPALPLARAAEPPAIEPFIARSGAALNEIAALEPAAARLACGAYAEASFDLPALARAIAGAQLWQALGESRRDSFQSVLRARLAADCARGRGAGELTLLANRAAPEGRSVAARLRAPDGSERLLVWRVRPGGPWGWQATDLTADGISLASMLRDEVRSAFDGGGGDPDAAIAGLARGAPLR